jgi:peptide/nickel transport system substrate-binding protein
MSGALHTILALSALSKAQASQTDTARSTLTVAMSIEPSSLDPTIAAPVSVGMVTWSNIFEGLVTIDRQGKIQPQLATEWAISPNGLTYTFKLRENVHFHNGIAFEAAVAKFSLDRARSPQSLNPQKRFFTHIDRIEAPDPRTLVIHLKSRNSSLLYWLGWPASVIVEPDSAQTNALNPIGTGPFRFDNWNHGKTIVLAANENYWGPDTIQLKSVTFIFESNASALANALRSRDIDVVPEFPTPDLVGGLQNDTALKTVIGVTEMKVIAGMNNARKPFDDLHVRQALMMAVDRDAIIDGAWGGLGTPIGSHYTPNDRAYRDLTGIYPYDPKKAKALLAQAGHPKGFAFTMKVPQMPYAVRCSEILQAAFAEIGVTMRIQPIVFPEDWTREVFERADYDMTIIAHAEPMDIGMFAQENCYLNYHNPDFDTLIDDIEQAVDEHQQNSLYLDAQTMLAKDVPALFLFALPKIGIWNAKVKGLWENEPMSSDVMADVYWDN